MKYHRSLESKSVALVYIALAILSAMADWIWKDHPLASWFLPLPSSSSLWIIAIVYIALTLFVGSIIMSFFRLGQELEKIFQQILTPISYFQILLLSILSGFIEEWFFRAVLSTHLGIILSSVFFALAHLIPTRKTWLWALWALQAGIILSFFYRGTQSLLFVSLIHSVINFFFLLRLNNSAHRAATRHA